MSGKNFRRVPDRYADGDGYSAWDCEQCNAEVRRYRGQQNVQCGCGAWFNSGGQRLRDDWQGNRSNWDENVSDMDGFEEQQLRADADAEQRYPAWMEADAEGNVP